MPRKPKISAEKIKSLKALARRIDAAEGRAIRARGKAAFARHDRLVEIIQSLKAERQRKGLTLAEIASRTGIAKPNLSRLENSAHTAPTFDTLNRYAQALGKMLRVELVAGHSR